MLNLLRQGGIIKVFMGGVVLLIMAAFAFGSGSGGGTLTDRVCVVEVDDACVEPKDYHSLLRFVAPPGATDKELKKNGFAGFAINALIERELLMREARKLGVGVSEEDVDNELSLGRVHYSWPAEAPVPAAVAQGMPYPQTGASELVTYIRVRNSETNAFDYNIYKRQIQNLLRMSPREFKDQQKVEIVANRVRAMVTAPVRVSEEEAFSAFERERSTATARTVTVRKSWFERFAVNPTDAAVEEFAKAESALVDEAWKAAQSPAGGVGDFKADCPIVSEIQLAFTPGASEEERAERGNLAKQLSDLLAAGVDFAHLARAFGDGPVARQGGAIGCLDAEKYGAGGAELLAAIAELPVGAVSDVIETPRGFHLVRAHGKLSAEDAERMGRTVAARRLLAEKLATEAARSFAAQLIEKAKAGADLSAMVDELVPQQVLTAGLSEASRATLLEAAKSASDVPEFEVGRPFSRASSPVPGLIERDVAAKVFALEKDGELIEQPLETYAGFAVLQLKEKALVTREDFETDKDQLLGAMKEQKRSEVLVRYLDRLRERANRIVIHPTFDPNAKESDAEGSPDDTNAG